MRHAILWLALVACSSSDVSRTLGARCDLSADCDERCLAPSSSWPGGFCTVSCDTSADCPDEAVCIDEDGGVCAFMCGIDPECGFLGEGYFCKERDRQGDASKVFVCRGD